MDLRFVALEELRPGSAWAQHCGRVLPAYDRWYFSEGDAARPTYLACHSALRAHMPELVPIWAELVALAGGSDRTARMLSLFRPPAYMAGCSQILWTRGEPALIRNYDYELDRCEGLLLHSAWSGTKVMASVDSVWGALDGMNEHGVAVSLAFGGRPIVGDGFGIPIILRYLLETCSDTAQAISVLSRVPCHMSYTVGVVDRAGSSATVFLNPDRPAEVVTDTVATNHQRLVEWPAHAAITGTLERHERLERLAADETVTVDSIVRRFLTAPLYARDHVRGFATLYTALYRPTRGELELHWPAASWRQSFSRFLPLTIDLAL